jgi:hypothetical protein
MFSPYYWNTYGVKIALRFVNKLWWKFMPGTIIKVRWPVGPVEIWHDDGGYEWYEESADPNDHYRPWMEEKVGKQGWDWDWSMTDNDIADNCLTVKFRKGKEQYAILAAVRWS